MGDRSHSKTIALVSAIGALVYYLVGFCAWIVLVFLVSTPRENNCYAAEATMTCYGPAQGVTATVVGVLLLVGGVIALHTAATAAGKGKSVVLRGMVRPWLYLVVAVAVAFGVTLLPSPESRSLEEQQAELRGRPHLEETLASYQGMTDEIGAELRTRFDVREWESERWDSNGCARLPDAEARGAGSVQLSVWVPISNAGSGFTQLAEVVGEVAGKYGFRSSSGSDGIGVFEAMAEHATVGFSQWGTGQAKLSVSTACLPV